MRASPSGWCVFYWRPGPDRRFNNANRWVDGDRVLEHARDWVRAFHRFQEIRDGYRGEAVYRENVGELEISIRPWRFDGKVRIGGGVYVRTKFPKLGVATDEQLDEVLDTLKWALERGPELVEQLNKLKATEPPPIDDPFTRLNHKRGR